MIRNLLRIGSVCTLLLAGTALAQSASPTDTPGPAPMGGPPDTPAPDRQQHRMSPQSSDDSRAGNSGDTRNDKAKSSTRNRNRSKAPPPVNGDDSQRPDSSGSTMP